MYTNKLYVTANDIKMIKYYRSKLPIGVHELWMVQKYMIELHLSFLAAVAGRPRAETSPAAETGRLSAGKNPRGRENSPH